MNLRKKIIQLIRPLKEVLPVAPSTAIKSLSTVETLSINIDQLVKMIYFGASEKFKEVIPEREVLVIVQTALVNEQEIGDIYAAIANLFVNAGQAELGIEYYAKALALKKNHAIHSLYLQTLVMSEASNSKILAECLEYVNEYYKNDHAAISNQNMFKEKQQNKILRVGYICHFLHNSVAKSIVLPFIKAHDRNKVEVYCYYDWDASEEREDMKRIAHHWRNTQNLNDDEFFNLIRDDDIDVLVEMNGHTAINRYSVCMRRAAPIQISFYNWAATSGIPNMDYNIIDNKVLDVSEDKYFTETIYRLPNAYGIANFDDTFPEVSPSPHLKNGYITFGSFGAAHKANENVVKLWCDVLHRVPNSKFFMKAGALSADFYKDNFYRYFHNNGIGKDRLIFEGWSPHHEMLCKYANVDIALDTFPYCGSTTTLEATWQGVPVITYSGNRLSTKSGTSMLTNLHLTEHIARTKEEVVEIASKLANNSERLINLRLNLRDKFKNSVLYDAKLFASDLEDAYYFMWKEWWAKKKSS